MINKTLKMLPKATEGGQIEALGYLLMLKNGSWHPCEMLSFGVADDYEGDRYCVVLSCHASGICPDTGGKFNYESGHKFDWCHEDCVGKMCPVCNEPKSIVDMDETHGASCRDCDTA